MTTELAPDPDPGPAGAGLLTAPPCPAHPKQPATTACRGCGLFLCPACAPDEPRCPRCRGAGHPIAWEDPARGGAGGLLSTLLAAFNAEGFFAPAPWSGGLRRPLWFSVIVATGATVLGALIVFVSTLLVALLVRSGALPADAARLIERLLSPSGLLMQAQVALILLTPLLAAMDTLVFAAVSHLIARAWGGQGSFEATLRVTAYSAAAEVFRLVPVVGALGLVFGRVAIAAVGLRKAHGLPAGRAWLAAGWWVLAGLVLALLALPYLLWVVASLVAR